MFFRLVPVSVAVASALFCLTQTAQSFAGGKPVLHSGPAPKDGEHILLQRSVLSSTSRHLPSRTANTVELPAGRRELTLKLRPGEKLMREDSEAGWVPVPLGKGTRQAIIGEGTFGILPKSSGSMSKSFVVVRGKEKPEKASKASRRQLSRASHYDLPLLVFARGPRRGTRLAFEQGLTEFFGGLSSRGPMVSKLMASRVRGAAERITALERIKKVKRRVTLQDAKTTVATYSDEDGQITVTISKLEAGQRKLVISSYEATESFLWDPRSNTLSLETTTQGKTTVRTEQTRSGLTKGVQNDAKGWIHDYDVDRRGRILVGMARYHQKATQKQDSRQ